MSQDSAVDSLPYAPVAQRFLALCLDMFVLTVVWASLKHVTTWLWTMFFWSLLTWIYFTGFEMSKWYATPGKRLLGLSVTTTDGETLSAMKVQIRFFAKFLSSFFFLGFLTAPFHSRKQGWHDLIAKSAILQNYKPSPLGSKPRQTGPHILSRRILALLIDCLIYVCILAATARLVIDPLFAFGCTLVWIATYHYILEQGPFGASLGKRLMKLRVVDMSAAALSPGRHILRQLIRPISFLSFFGVAGSIFSQKRRTLHDLLSGAVINVALADPLPKMAWRVPAFAMAGYLLMALAIGFVIERKNLTVKPSMAPVTYDATHHFLRERAKLLLRRDTAFHLSGYPTIIKLKNDLRQVNYLEQLALLPTESVDKQVLAFVNQRNQLLKIFSEEMAWSQKAFWIKMCISLLEIGNSTIADPLVVHVSESIRKERRLNELNTQIEKIEEYLASTYKGKIPVYLVQNYNSFAFQKQMGQELASEFGEGNTPFSAVDLGVLKNKQEVTVKSVIQLKGQDPTFFDELTVEHKMFPLVYTSLMPSFSPITTARYAKFTLEKRSILTFTTPGLLFHIFKPEDPDFQLPRWEHVSNMLDLSLEPGVYVVGISNRHAAIMETKIVATNKKKPVAIESRVVNNQMVGKIKARGGKAHPEEKDALITHKNMDFYFVNNNYERLTLMYAVAPQGIVSISVNGTPIRRISLLSQRGAWTEEEKFVHRYLKKGKNKISVSVQSSEFQVKHIKLH